MADCKCINGYIMRYSDGQKVRCPICLGRNAEQKPEPTLQPRRPLSERLFAGDSVS